MLHNNYEMKVLVKGRPIGEYLHEGQTFIEGRDRSNFEVEFKNLTSQRVEVVLSVDGLSVIDGEEAGPQSSGYVVDAFGTIRIPGWKLNADQVAAFQFTGKRKSYVSESTGSARNTGVLGALVFFEKKIAPVHQYHYTTSNVFPNSGIFYNGGTPTYGSGSGGALRSMSKGIAPSGGNAGGWVGATLSGDVSYTSATASSVAPQGFDALIGASINNMSEVPLAPVEQTLGTGFGKATDFETTEVSFTRGDLGAMIVMYYDDSRGLRARGIELVRPSKQRVAPANAPQAFPGMKTGCNPPAGWKG